MDNQSLKRKTINNNVENIYKLTSLQEGILFHKLLDNNSKSYFLQDIFKIIGIIDEEKIRQSLDLLFIKHDVLRTLILYRKTEKPLQIVLKERKAEFNSMDLSDLDEEVQQKEIERIKNSDIERGVSFEKESLLRMTFIKTKVDETIILWSIHHIIVDGWCTSLLFRDLMNYYTELHKGKSFENLREQVVDEKKYITSYGDYINWLGEKDKKEGLNYWKKLLGDYEESINIIPKGPSIYSETQVETAILTTDNQWSKDVIEFSKKNNFTISTIFETALGILLQKYNMVDDVVFGKVVSGRNVELPNIEQTVGLFINTIPTRVKCTKEMTCMDLLKLMREQSYDSESYDYCSLAEIQAECSLGRNLINILYVYENYYIDQSYTSDIDNIKVEKIASREQTNYNMSFRANFQETFYFDIMYNPSIYEKDEINLVLTRFKNIVSEIILDSSKRTYDIRIIDDNETKLVQYLFNDTTADFPSDKTVAEIFEEQVKRVPDKIAVTFGNEELTYRELNERANQLARKIRKMGGGANDYVAILSKKSIDMVTGIYAIIKAGCAYVPIDPSFPDDRIKYILKDCKPKIVLLRDKEIDFEINMPMIKLCQETYQGDSSNLEKLNTPDDSVYVIYTSGTTGSPKGVANTHKGLINRIDWMQKEYPLNEDDVLLQKTTFIFDVSVWEFLWWGFVGAKLVILKQDGEKEPYEICEAVMNYQISVIHFVPSMFHVFLLYLQGNKKSIEALKSVKYFFSGGEVLNLESLHQFNELIRSRYPDIKLINCYGPSEASIDVTYFECDENCKIIPIGKPIANTQIYILNNTGLCGVLMLGELCIAGTGLAKGYVNQPDLTNEKFVNNPYGSGKLYHSGDLARWLPDGMIEYRGRMDDQVKIRGYRIELDEIENVIRKIEEIQDCAVVVKKDKNEDQHICAYLISKNQLSIGRIKEILKSKLTEYMIPSFITQIDKIPLKQNGKLDTKMLPEITYVSEQKYVAARNETEQKLVEIFESILGINNVGIQDNFFDLGGQSLKATRVMNKIESVTGVRLSLRDIFTYPTVSELRKLVDQVLTPAYEPIPQVEEKDYYVMSPAQKRLYILQEIDDRKIVYNIPMGLEYFGTISIEKAKSVLEQMVNRHEVLHTSFHMIDGEPVQKIEKEVNIDFTYSECFEVTEQEKKELFQNFVSPFDLAHIPLLRMKIIKCEKGNSLLFLDIHHIIFDAVSMNIFVKEFSTLYSGGKLEPLKVQYKDYSEWFRKRDISEQKVYWTNVFGDDVPVLNLPIDHLRPKVTSYHGKDVTRFIDYSLKEKILALCKETEATEFMVLLSAYMILLGKYSHQEDIVVGTPISGRIHQDTEKLLGMFVNTLALRGKLNANFSVLQCIDSIKEVCLKSFDNQEYPFEELVEALDIKRDAGRNPLFDVMFLMQDGDKETIKSDEVGFKFIDVERTVAKFDMTLGISGDDDGYFMKLEYNIDLFNADTVERMLNHYVNILEEIVENPKIMICEIQVASKEEQELILNKFNNTDADLFDANSVIQLFERQVEKNPDNVALVYNNDSITYKDLNIKANQLAFKLRSIGVKPNDYVALLAERSIEMVVGIYAVIKAGGAYVPVDCNLPSERLMYMINDCKPVAILVTNGMEKIDFDVPIINLSDEQIYVGQTSNPSCVNTPDDLIYAIYTSGTSGKPKGVMIEHKGVINLLSVLSKKVYEEYKEGINVALVSSYVFDASVKQLFTPLILGHTVHIISDDLKTSGEELEAYYVDHSILITDGTPTLMKILTSSQSNFAGFLEKVMIGGEKLQRSLIRKIIKKNKNVKVFNVYGPTEATVDATIHECNIGLDNRSLIGKPIDNTKIYILDGNNLCGIGVPGELCIAGVGIARGYINDPDLTKEKFINNPYGDGILYRSGDMAKWQTDGNIEYLGRIDNQVKVRGYRIELGEIEEAIMKIDEVRDVAVILNNGQYDEKNICAYLVSDYKINIEDIRRTLRKILPEYMLPQYMMQIDALPSTRNGKLDYRRLPDIVVVSENTYQVPNNIREEKLVEIFEEILGVDHIGINDDFFMMGGNSLKATQVISKLKDFSGIRLPLKELFNNSTVKSLSQLILDYLPIQDQENINIFFQSNLDNRKKNIFLFPPITGYGVFFNKLADVLPEYNIYAFDFYEDDNRIEQYIREILKLQKSGEYILGGYSVGGNIAFEVTYQMRHMGYQIKDLIIIDSAYKDEVFEFSEKTCREKFESECEFHYDEWNSLDDDALEIYRKKHRAYYQFFSTYVCDSVIDVDIHYIFSSSQKNMRKWKNLTIKKVYSYKGNGDHWEMIEGNNVNKIAEIMRMVIEKK